MSDRFYLQMREATGWCPGLPEIYKTKRRRKVAWTDEAKAQAVEMYTAEEPTPETDYNNRNIFLSSFSKKPYKV